MREISGDRPSDRRRMVVDVERTAAEFACDTGRAELNERVLAAIGKVPRHIFVPFEYRKLAYKNRPLPIGFGQTISQPFIVALMTDLLELKGTQRVLEIGTGCGYQTAVLSLLAREVHTIEIVEALASEAAVAFKQLGIENIAAHTGDGRNGWPEASPFDAILLTAAAERIPQAIVEQLKPGGRLVAPVGTTEQRLEVTCKETDGSVVAARNIGVKFVPMK